MSPRFLNTTLATLRTPGWHRSVLLRRAAALFLVLAAGVTAVTSTRDKDPHLAVLVRDIAAGEVVTDTDFDLVPVPDQLHPEGAVTDPAAVADQVAATVLRAGTVATDVNFIGQRLVDDLLGNTGEPGNLVPLKLAEPDVIALLRHGETVTVVSHDGDSPQPVVIAEGARVVSTGTDDADTVLLALPESAARQVAATALTAPLAVVLTG